MRRILADSRPQFKSEIGRSLTQRASERHGGGGRPAPAAASAAIGRRRRRPPS